MIWCGWVGPEGVVGTEGGAHMSGPIGRQGEAPGSRGKTSFGGFDVQFGSGKGIPAAPGADARQWKSGTSLEGTTGATPTVPGERWLSGVVGEFMEGIGEGVGVGKKWGMGVRLTGGEKHCPEGNVVGTRSGASRSAGGSNLGGVEGNGAGWKECEIPRPEAGGFLDPEAKGQRHNGQGNSLPVLEGPRPGSHLLQQGWIAPEPGRGLSAGSVR